MNKNRSLKKNEMFLKVYKRGSRVHQKYFVLHYLPNGGSCNRLGIKVSKKIAAAVGRNRLKRLVRECCRLFEPELKTGYDLVVVAKEGSPSVSGLVEVQRCLGYLFMRAGLYADSGNKSGRV